MSTDFNEPLAFRLTETWVIAGVARAPDGTVIDLTGATLTFAVSARGGAEVFSTTTFGVVEAAAGSWLLTLQPDDREDADPAFADRVYAYRVSIETADGSVYVLNAGSLTLTA